MREFCICIVSQKIGWLDFYLQFGRGYCGGLLLAYSAMRRHDGNAVFLGTAFERIDIAGFVLVLSTGFILNVRKRKD